MSGNAPWMRGLYDRVQSLERQQREMEHKQELEREPGTWRHACGRFLKYSRDVASNAGACPRCGTRFSPNGLAFLSAIEEIETEQDELEDVVSPAPEEGSSN